MTVAQLTINKGASVVNIVFLCLPDFNLFRITPAGGRCIGGFGRVVSFSAAALRGT